MTRLTEPSSAAGIAAIIGGISACFANDWLTGIGMICAGVAAILVPERK